MEPAARAAVAAAEVVVAGVAPAAVVVEVKEVMLSQAVAMEEKAVPVEPVEPAAGVGPVDKEEKAVPVAELWKLSLLARSRWRGK